MRLICREQSKEGVGREGERIKDGVGKGERRWKTGKEGRRGRMRRVGPSALPVPVPTPA